MTQNSLREVIAELSRTRSALNGAPRVRNSIPCIPEILVLQREKKPKETNFVGRKTKKFYSGGEKKGNAGCYQGENERQRQKK